ncbi:MAG: gamma-glutamyl-gamma-aminobutyrate hydrolase family protein, partial [Acidobacteriota bacterium]|nr:gamma-glutamyl-gamma-aminobutyrate hydrolase family protein [Acidobacteriota bacterium]
MFSRCYKQILLTLALAAVSAGWTAAGAKTPDRFFDAASDRGPEVRLTVFYPSVGKIRDLVTLRESRLLDIPNLVVIGVYHEKERTNYGMSRKFVEDNQLDWFKFHPVSRPVSPDALFQKNGCSPEFEAIAGKSDGVIFFGGPDIPPSIYKEKTHLLTVIDDPYRHYFELSAIFHLLGGSQDDHFECLLESRPGFPVLGICLGFQSLNVGTGGSLIQDIWTEVYGQDSVEGVLNIGPENWHNNPFARLYPQEKLAGYSLHTLNLD